MLDRYSTDTRSNRGRYVDRYSADISAECRSIYRPIVSTDTTYSKHDPKWMIIAYVKRYMFYSLLCTEMVVIYRIHISSYIHSLQRNNTLNALIDNLNTCRLFIKGVRGLRGLWGSSFSRHPLINSKLTLILTYLIIISPFCHFV